MLPAARSVPPLRFSLLKSRLLVLALTAAFTPIGLAGRADAQCSGTGTTTYTSTGGVSVAAGTISTSTSTITVPTLPAGSIITCVSVVLTGVTSNGSGEITNSYGTFGFGSMEDAALMLTAPSGPKLEFLGATGDGTDGDNLNDSGSGLDNVNITVWDGASVDAPYAGFAPPAEAWPHTCTTACPVVKPSSYFNAAYVTEGNPPLGSSSQWAQTDGSATFADQFDGGLATPDGNWTLSLTDNNPFTGGDPVSVTSWSLVMTVVAGTNADTTTSISSNSTNDTSFTGGANSLVTLTAGVSSTSSVDAGTVKFTDGSNTISGCGTQPVSSGVATCATTLTTEGIHTLGASYSGTTGFNPSSTSNPLHQFVKNHSTLSGGEYCNSGGITVNGEQITPYPSVVNVGTDTTALTGTVADLSITLEDLSASAGLFPGYGFMLVAPGGGTHNLDFLSSVGTSGSQSAINLKIADDNPSGPVDGPLSSTTYGPTDVSNSADAFVQATSPAPQVPGTINYAQPDFFGSNPLTLSQAFSGVDPNGDWTLYGYNNGGDSLAVTGGWCLAFTVNSGAATTTTLTALSPAFTGNPVTITATVTSGGNPVSGGTVTFTENGAAPAGVSNNVATVNGSGQASITTSSLAEGDHDIVATYSGVSNTYGTSSDSRWYRENTATTASGASATFCNPGGFTLPNQAESADNIGAAAPNPSNIFVANLPGTISKVSLELEDFQTNPLSDTIYYTSSLLVGPGAATANTLDFFSGTGTTDNETELAKGNYIFADSGSELVPQADFGPGTYLPTSYDTSGIKGTYTASPSGFYTLPGSFNYAATRGSSTFDSVYGNADANGTWSLYFYQNFSVVTTQATATGWCLDFTENLPSASVTASHNGSGFHGEFAQGETNAEISVAITNNGPGPTGDPTGSNPLTVTDDLNLAFTYSNFSGTGWSCSASSQTVTCKNDSAIAESSPYPELTIDVNVSASAGTPINNSVSVSGAGVASTNSNTDSITIQPDPLLSVTKTHPGTFKAGQTAEWDITVSNAETSSSTSGAVTVYDALPMGYTLSSYAGTGWSCSGTTTATCMSSQGVGGGASFDTLALTVDVPTNSPSSVSNTALAWGGGSLTQTNSGNAASGSDLDVTVMPATVNVTIGTSPAGLGFSIGGVGYTTTQMPALTVGTGYSLNTTSPQNLGVTGVQYAFSQWSDGTLTTADTLTPTLSTTSDTAMFTTQYFLTVSAGTGGTIAVTTAPNAFYNAGTTQTIAATPSAGYYFTGWTGANSPSDIASATSASTTVTMNGPENITANFAPIPGYVVTTLADDPPGTAANCPIANTPPSSSCTLRDAITAADANNGGEGNITFASGLTGTIDLTSVTPTALPTLRGQISITGPGANVVTVSGNNSATVGSIFAVYIGATVGISGLTIANGSAYIGGAINNSGTLTLANNTFSGNSVGTYGSGGAIVSSGTLTVGDSTFSGNHAGNDGSGGAISSSNTLKVTNSTFSGNYTGNDGSGGAIGSTGTLTVNDSTFSGNYAGSSGNGGAIDSAYTTTVNNSIFSGNYVGTGGLGGGITGGAATNVSNSVFYNNVDTLGTDVDNCNGCSSNNNEVTGNPNLAAPGNYGGPTQTMIPLPGSSAICAGSSGLIPAGITTDQRGFPNTNTSYGFTPSPCVDAGAVQTNYSLGFTTEPTGVSVATDFAAAVTLNESGNPFQPGVTIPLTLTGSGTLTGGSATTSAGVASYTLQVDTVGSSDTLTANLTLNSALDPAVAISATSNAFGVGMTTPTVGLDYSTSGSIGYGTPETFYAYLPPGATGTVTFYNNGSTPLNSVPAPVSGGTATFSSSTLAVGSYSITAAYSGDSNYNPNTSSALSLTVYPSPATMASPTPSSALTSAATTFTWNTVSGSVTYGLNVGTTGVGSADLVNIGPLSGPSVTVNLPTNGTMIYVRLWTIYNGTGYLYNDYTYTEFTQSPAAITSPAPGTTLTTAATTFTWSPGPVGTTSYGLNIGTTGVGSADLVNIGPLPLAPPSVTVNLPTNGTTIYVRLWTIVNGTTYLANDYTYTEFTQSPAVITSPAPGTTLTSAATTFTWSPGPAGTTGYGLNIGTTGVGSADLVNIYPVSGTSVTVNLPTNGTMIYVRLWTVLNGTTFLYNDYTYTEFTQSPAAITSPMPGSTLTSAATTFTWSAGPAGTTGYGLNVGTTGVGSADLVNIGPLPLSPTSVTVNLPTNGTPIYVRLWTILNGTTYLYNDYTYTEFTQ